MSFNMIYSVVFMLFGKITWIMPFGNDGKCNWNGCVVNWLEWYLNEN